METPDIHSSSAEYAARFSGSVGAWLLRVQSENLLQLLRGFPRGTVLDVGGGHGQLAAPLHAAGFAVTVLGSSPACSVRLQNEIRSGICTFATGDLLKLPYPDNSFDYVVSFRIISHLEDWKKFIAELSRVARRAVLIDYPRQTTLGANPLLFALKKKFEGNTRTYHSYREADLLQEFARHGCSRSGSVRQFVLPMVLHRTLKNAAFSEKTERLLRALHLNTFFGGPVILMVTKRDN